MQRSERLKTAPAALPAAILAGNDFQFDHSIAEFESSIQLSPNYATAHHWLGDGPLMTLGRFDRAVSEGKRAGAMVGTPGR